MPRHREGKCRDCHVCDRVNYGTTTEAGQKVERVLAQIGEKYAYALGPVLCELFEQTDADVRWVIQICQIYLGEKTGYNGSGVAGLLFYLEKQISAAAARH